MIYWGGGQKFSTSHHEKCITNLSLLLQFQIIFSFQLKDIHKNTYSSISNDPTTGGMWVGLEGWGAGGCVTKLVNLE